MADIFRLGSDWSFFMKIRSVLMPLLAVACALPLTAHATVFQFNATINGANEVGGSTDAGSGVATLSYNDMGTLSLGDDSYNFSMSVFGLSGVATAYHIHGPANSASNGAVRVSLDASPFVSFNAGGTLLVGGNGVAPSSFGAMSMLDALMGSLAYVNVHTAANPGGAVRGQLILVAASVPEPSSYALLMAGLGVVGFVARRRR
jgi:hypothetical protein